MWGSYFRIAIGHLLKHKLYSLINVVGLAVGLACTVLIGLYVLDELSYDRFFADSDRIYRVSRDYYPSEFRINGRYPASINAPFAPQLKAEFPEVAEAARLFPVTPTARLNDEPVIEEMFGFVDQSFLSVFSFRWLEGTADGALSEPNSIVLTQSLADKYFGDAPALGQTFPVILRGDVELRVTGVIADLPGNTHLQFSALASMGTIFAPERLGSWDSNTDFHTYIKLHPGARIENLANQFPAFVDRHVGANASAVSGVTAMPITDIHLRSTRAEELKATGSIGNVRAFTAIAVGILLIACINFMNLSTARSSQRSKEVGMRKVIGARRQQLVGQFLGESLLMSLLAMTLALALVEVLLPSFSAFTGKAFGYSLLQQVQAGFVLLGLVVVVGIVAGSYPAFFLSSFKPARVLKGDASQGGAGILFRQGLVVLQFAISIALVVATLVIYAQMEYARSIDLGIEREQVVIISGTPNDGLGTQWEAMKQKLLNHPEITDVSRSHYRPFTHDDNFVPVLRQKGTPAEEVQSVKYMSVDYDFFATYGIGLLAGRAFDAARGADRMPSEQIAAGAFVINPTMARTMGWTPEQAVDQPLWLALGEGVSFGAPIVGVTVDSHFESLTTPIEPLIFFIPPASGDYLPLREGAIRVTGNDLAGTLAFIDATWKEFLPQLPLNRHFLDEDFDALYRDENRQGEMLGYFTTLAIFIASLGLYGLASFNAERRTKEIGVRKVMGGSVWGIVVLLTNDFSKLVLLANVIAWPLAYFVMERWLQNFAYRIDITPVIFIGSGLIALCIAWVTVGGTAAKAASAKPILALRYE